MDDPDINQDFQRKAAEKRVLVLEEVILELRREMNRVKERLNSALGQNARLVHDNQRLHEYILAAARIGTGQ